MFKKYLYIISFVFLSSCLVGPKYQQPAMNVPQKFTANDSIVNKDSLNLKWFDVYKDPKLNELIKLALANNKDLLIAASRIEEASSNLKMTQANNTPSVDLYAKKGELATNTNATGAGVGFSTSSNIIGVRMAWEIDFWGKYRHANKAAREQMLAMYENQKTIKMTLVADVATYYFMLRDLDNRLEVAKRTIASRQESVRLLTLRFNGGDIAEIDKLQAEQLLASAEVVVPQIEREIVKSQNNLNILLGRMPTEIPRGLSNFEQDLPLTIPVGLPSSLLTRRPDIQYAERQLIAQTHRIGMTQAMRFPVLSLTGFVGLASRDLSTLISNDSYARSLFGELFLPIFQFGKNKRRVEIERKRTEQAVFLYEKTALTAFAEVDNSLNSVDAYQKELLIRQKQVATSKRSVELAYARYNNGFSSYLEVLENERYLFDAENLLSVTKSNQLISVVQLYKSLGGGWQE